MKSYSVLVVGCDKHKSLLDRFFKQFVQYWAADDVAIYVSLEREDYSYDGLDLNVTKYGLDWSKRVKKTVEQIKTPAVLLLLDDFLIEGPVNKAELNKLSGLIENDDTIAHFALTTVPMKNSSDELFYGRYYERDHFGRYKTTLQAGMWNRDELVSLLREGEGAWEVEVYANFRSYLSQRKYYAIADKKYKPIDYNDGFFCIQGKVNLQELKRLNEKFNEDFSVPGMSDNGGIVERDPCPFFKRVIRRIKLTIMDGWYRLLWITKQKGK